MAATASRSTAWRRPITAGSVSAAGDVNGDGFAARLEQSSLNGANGCQINGEALSDQSGASVSSAGDINGDGFDDIIVGAVGGDPHRSPNPGASYVIFGKAAGLAANLGVAGPD